MKIYILGASGSGKTTLAKRLTEKHKIPHYDLDYIRHEVSPNKGFKTISEDDFLEKLQKITNKNSWIIEGINVVPLILEKSDKIIFINTPFLMALFRQWKRYFTDARQRKIHGFRGNLKLSRFILKQYLETSDPKRINDIDYNRVKKTKLILKRYGDKVEVI